MDAMETKSTASDIRLDKVEADAAEDRKAVAGVRDDLAKVVESAKVSMSSEFRDRDSRRLNIVIHGLVEPPDTVTDNHSRVSQDREKLVELGNVIGS